MSSSILHFQFILTCGFTSLLYALGYSNTPYQEDYTHPRYFRRWGWGWRQWWHCHAREKNTNIQYARPGPQSLRQRDKKVNCRSCSFTSIFILLINVKNCCLWKWICYFALQSWVICFIFFDLSPFLMFSIVMDRSIHLTFPLSTVIFLIIMAFLILRL